MSEQALALSSVPSSSAHRNPGRPRGSRTSILAPARAPALSLVHANFVRAAIMHSSSSLDLVQVARRYLGHQLEGQHGSEVSRLARDTFAGFLAAGPDAVAALKRSAQGLPAGSEPHQAARELERALQDLTGVDPMNVARTSPSPAPSPATPLPTLDEWIAEYEAEHPHVDLGEFSEGELLEMYRDELGLDLPHVREEPEPPTKTPVDPVLVARDFMFLAGQVAVLPKTCDNCDRWLAPSVATALMGSSPPVKTLADLRIFIGTHGFRWWTKVRGLGVARAMRVAQWLETSSEGPDAGKRRPPPLPLPAGAKAAKASLKALGGGSQAYGLLLDSVARQAFPKRPGVAPVEFLALNPVMEDETVLVTRWLNGMKAGSATQRAYHLAIERLVIWMHARGDGLTLACLKTQHLEEFRGHLAAPPPEWCSPLRSHRNDVTWRPMRSKDGAGGLADASLDLNIAAIRSFYAWARIQGWTATP